VLSKNDDYVKLDF